MGESHLVLFVSFHPCYARIHLRSEIVFTRLIMENSSGLDGALSLIFSVPEATAYLLS